MRRKVVLALCFSAGLMVGQAHAGTFLEKYTQRLKTEGFTQLTVSRTWLGRTRIVASSKTQTREVVFNGVTGEILRDYSEDVDDGSEGTNGETSSGNESSSDTGDASGGDSEGESEGDSGGDSGSGGGGGGQAWLSGEMNPDHYLLAGNLVDQPHINIL